MSRGLFVSFEGVEGVGKSTQIAAFIETLKDAGIDVVQTREPGGTPNAERIRNILKDHADESMPPVAELLLMFAARAINTANTIRPAIEAGNWVVADRYTDSTRAYQGGGRGQPMDRINAVAEWVHGDINPDITVLLDAPAEVGLARASGRGEADRFETEAVAFFEAVRATYLDLAANEPERFIVIDASDALEAVRERVRQAASDLINRFREVR
ncbi:MAG: dTMP kinase [Woeseiaceae bacterium]|nr:dTMP kinase [Woeseiaceae bacterium]